MDSNVKNTNNEPNEFFFEPNITLGGVKFFFCPLCKKNFEEFGIKDEKIIDISNRDSDGYNIVLIEFTDSAAIGAFITHWAFKFKKRFIIDYDPKFPNRVIIRLVNAFDGDCDIQSSNRD